MCPLQQSAPISPKLYMPVTGRLVTARFSFLGQKQGATKKNTAGGLNPTCHMHACGFRLRCAVTPLGVVCPQGLESLNPAHALALFYCSLFMLMSPKRYCQRQHETRDGTGTTYHCCVGLPRLNDAHLLLYSSRAIVAAQQLRVCVASWLHAATKQRQKE